MDIEIRALTQADIERVVELEMQAFGETLGAEMLTNELTNVLVKFRVITLDKKVIGYIGGYFYMEDGEILNFLIDDAYQHQGFGQRLFDYVMGEAQTELVKCVTLEVRENNLKGLNFYKKNGFNPISVRKHYYKNGDNAIVMMKELV